MVDRQTQIQQRVQQHSSSRHLFKHLNQDHAEKMIRMLPCSAIWCAKWWICSWSYWLSTRLSTVITFSSLCSAHVWSALLCFRSMQFLKISISQCIVETSFRCGEIWYDLFIASFPLSGAVLLDSFLYLFVCLQTCVIQALGVALHDPDIFPQPDKWVSTRTHPLHTRDIHSWPFGYRRDTKHI